MNTTRKIFSLGILIVGVLLSVGIVVNAEGNGVLFPVAELGNCVSKEACRVYCEDATHMTACVSFGEKNNLISAEDATHAKEFADVLRGEGPGQCKDKNTCESYCDDMTHIDECIAFAEKHNLANTTQLAEGKKIATLLKSGEKLPGQCKTREECESYCKNPEKMDECIAFAEMSGMLSSKEIAKAKKVLPFIKNGTSPGKCKTKDECESYCTIDAHMDECVAFAEKAGIIDAEELAIVKKTGGRGPGGCKSKESCDAFCNDSKNQSVCFEFAKKYNLIPEEKLKEIQDGMGRLRSGINQAPPEVVQCLKDNLGQNIVQDIEAGTLTPGPAIGERVKGCFEQFMPKIKERIQSGLKQASPEILQCLENGLGGAEKLKEIENGAAPTPEMGDVMKNCFAKMKTEGLLKIKETLTQLPPEAKACLENKIGKDTIAKISAGEDVVIGPEIGDIIQGCVGGLTDTVENKLEDGLRQVPPEMRSCIEEKLQAAGVREKMVRGEMRGPEAIQPYIQECTSSFVPKGMPTINGENFPEMKVPEGIPEGSIPPQFQGGMPGEAEMCSKFLAVPSCDFVPVEVRDLCKKCRG